MCPFPNYYAVIQMDPKTMIKDLRLDDEQSLKEVEAMQPQKYLIYLELVRLIYSCFRYPQLPPWKHFNAALLFVA